MKLDPAAIIADEKITHYLLVPRVKNDKSSFFARGGYTLDNWWQLAADLHSHVLAHEAALSRRSIYGDLYTIRAPLRGPNGVILDIVSVWIVERDTDDTRFVTAYPAS